ncbi:MAG: hypothetical protein L3V56_00730 [Candidatus Magnetoovum sp. WYHC-5]|nr:hypothetical protein [Candidatus Magnetoovum sp. WYHC-5]
MFNNLKISQKMIVLALLLVTGFVGLGVTYAYILHIGEIGQEKDDQILQITEYISEVNISIAQARRDEKNFLLRNQPEYIENLKKDIEKTLTFAESLRVLLESDALKNKIDKLSDIIQVYQE